MSRRNEGIWCFSCENSRIHLKILFTTSILSFNYLAFEIQFINYENKRNTEFRIYHLFRVILLQIFITQAAATRKYCKSMTLNHSDVILLKMLKSVSPKSVSLSGLDLNGRLQTYKTCLCLMILNLKILNQSAWSDG